MPSGRSREAYGTGDCFVGPRFVFVRLSAHSAGQRTPTSFSAVPTRNDGHFIGLFKEPLIGSIWIGAIVLEGVDLELWNIDQVTGDNGDHR